MPVLVRLLLATVAILQLFSASSKAETWKTLMARADSLFKAQEQDSAIAVGQKALEKATAKAGKEDTLVASILSRLAAYNASAAKGNRAEELYKTALSIREKRFGSESMDVATSLNDLGLLYIDQQKYSEAEPLLNRALSIREKICGPQHVAVAASLNNLGILYTNQGKYAEAEPLFQRSLHIREKVYGPEHLIVAKSLDNLSGLYHYQGKYSEGVSYVERALSILEKNLGGEHPDVAFSLQNLADLLSEQGKYSEAEPLFKRALAIYEKSRGSESIDAARVLRKLADLYLDQREYVEAEALYNHALVIFQKFLGPEDKIIAITLGSLASLYDEQGKYSQAEPLYKKSLAIFEKALGSNHQYVAITLNNLATFYSAQSNYSEAEMLYKRALVIYENTFGKDHPHIGMILNNLASLYIKQARYADAEPYLERVISIYEKALGLEHPWVAMSLTNLAILKSDQGNYADAERLSKRALGIYEKAAGPNSLDVSNTLYYISDLYCMQGRYDDAEPMLKRAISIKEVSLGPDDPSLATSLNNLGSLCYNQGRGDEAEALLKRAIQIYKKEYGSNSCDLAISLVNLANLYSDQEKYIEADSLSNMALHIDEKILGPCHPDVAAVLESRSRLFRLWNNYYQAEELAKKAVEIRKKNFEDNAFVLSEKDALSFSGLFRNSVGNYLTCVLELAGSTGTDGSDAADIILDSKGQVSDDIFRRHTSLLQEEDSVTIALGDQLRFIKSKISKSYIEGPGEDAMFYRATVDSLSAIEDNLESDLARRSNRFKTQQEHRNVRADSITSLLPRNSIVVEYLRYDYYQLRPDSIIGRYLAVILEKSKKPQLIDLGPATTIESLIDQYRRHIQAVSKQHHKPLKEDRDQYATIALKLYDKILRPVDFLLSGKELVFIAPDGALNIVSFAGLIDKNGRYLIEKYAIHYLSAGRDVVRLQQRDKFAHGLFALGDPDYDFAGFKPAQYASAQIDPYRARNVRSGCGDLHSAIVERLPSTREEIALVEERWKAATNEPADIYFGSDASEDNFKAKAPGRRVIHLATHGYFLQGACSPDQNKQRTKVDEGFVGENPLLLSGLFLAGANQHGKLADSLGTEDGILTAYEVSAMDLRGTDLVVLSACETALGDVKQGEGVYGLRRAFQMAGARTIVCTLWPVPDEATAGMMAQLYGHSRKPLPERLRQMQLDQIKKLRKKGYADHPYNWAGFIAIGDWR